MLVVDPAEEYAGQTVQVSNEQEFADALRRSPGRWRLSYFNTHLEDDFAALCATVSELGSCTFVVEEADWYCSPSAIHPGLAYLLKYGRHDAVEVWCIARRPSELHRLCTSMAKGVFCFQTVEPNDKKYLQDYVSSVFADDLADLPPLVCKQQLRVVGATPTYWRVDPRLATIVPVVVESKA